MSKKIIISESERKKILSLYGLINEAAEDDKFEIKAQNYFAPGYHSNLNPKIKQSITQQLLSAKNFLKRKEKEGKVVFIKIQQNLSVFAGLFINTCVRQDASVNAIFYIKYSLFRLLNCY